MIFTVSSAAAALRSTQNTCAPSRAKVTAVALPLPQPGPIEPAPTTIATLPLSRSIEILPFVSIVLRSYPEPLSSTRASPWRGQSRTRRRSPAPGAGTAEFRRTNVVHGLLLRPVQVTRRRLLERHVQAFGDVGAETRGDDDAAAYLLLGGVGGPDRIAAGAEERVGVRRLGFGGIERVVGIGVEDAGLFDAATVSLHVDHFFVVAGQRQRDLAAEI